MSDTVLVGQEYPKILNYSLYLLIGIPVVGLFYILIIALGAIISQAFEQSSSLHNVYLWSWIIAGLLYCGWVYIILKKLGKVHKIVISDSLVQFYEGSDVVSVPLKSISEVSISSSSIDFPSGEGGSTLDRYFMNLTYVENGEDKKISRNIDLYLSPLRRLKYGYKPEALLKAFAEKGIHVTGEFSNK